MNYKVQLLKKQLFPLSEVSNIKWFYFLQALNNTWFIEANWFFYWLRFMSSTQLGILDATMFGYGMIAEVPSGAISDLIGKKKSIIIAMFLASLGGIIMALGQNFWHLALGFFVSQNGLALYSGSAEALAYDSLLEVKKEDKYEEVISASTSINSVVETLGILIGGFLYAWHYRASHFAWGISYLLAAFVAFKFIEPAFDSEKFSLQQYIDQIKDGTKTLFNKQLKFYAFIIILLMGADFLFDWGLVRPATAKMFGFLADEQVWMLISFIMINALFVKFLPTFRRKFSDKKGLFLLTIIMGIGFLASSLPLGFWGILPMLLISITGSLAYPWVSIVVNRHTPSRHRATTLSVIALLAKLPYVLLAVVAGKMVEAQRLPLFLLSYGSVILLSLGITWVIKKVSQK